jgi:hypothetical protein
VTVGFDDDVPDVTGVAGAAVEQSAVAHDAATDPGRHHHCDVGVDTARRADPALAERKSLGVVVDEHRQAERRMQTCTQGKRAPRRDVQR